MNINIFTNEDWFEYDLTNHDIVVRDGDLWVYKMNEFNVHTDTVALFAQGEWRRVGFDPGTRAVEDHGMGSGPYDD